MTQEVVGISWPSISQIKFILLIHAGPIESLDRKYLYAENKTFSYHVILSFFFWPLNIWPNLIGQIFINNNYLIKINIIIFKI